MPKITHRLSQHQLSKRWYNIQSRCYNTEDSAYQYYWWRWVKCEWVTITEFIHDMYRTFKPWLTLDRVDNNGNYSKNNCKWVTRKEQSNNRRSNVINGWLKEYCINNWLSYELIKKRIYRGASFEKAINMKIQIHKKSK